MFRSLILAATLLSTVASGLADERYLVPIVTADPVPGAFGSVWKSVFSVTNNSDQVVYVGVYRNCHFECVVPIPARGTIEAIPALTPFPGKVGPGDFLWVDSDAANAVSVSLRVQDTSRQDLTYGTEIPVVPSSKGNTAPIQLVGVPTDDRFRQTFRVYDLDSREGARVEVNLYSDEGAHLGTRMLELQTAADPVQRTGRPGYAEIGWLMSEFPAASAVPKVRVEVRPVTPGLRFWAFVSVIHNETQHLTVISPAVK